MSKLDVYALLSFCVLGISSNSLFYIHDDHRYPEYIINDPRVNCQESGSYPHPANCSWYYRCVDRMEAGHFHVFYFECEPGTIFLDELDQCVFGTASSPPCTPGASVAWPPLPPVPLPPSLLPEPVLPTPDNGSQPSIPDLVEEPEPTTPPPDEGPQSPYPPPIEEPQPPSPPVEESRPIPPDTVVPEPQTPDLLPEIPPEVTDAQTPGEINETQAAVTQITETPAPNPPLPPVTIPPVVSQSVTQCRNCRDEAVCEEGFSPTITLICEQCKVGDTEYKNAAQTCRRIPEPHLDSFGRCVSGLDFCPAIRQVIGDRIPGDTSSLCMESGTRPDDPEIRLRNCQNYHYCARSGVYLGSQTLCEKFYQCYKISDGRWTTKMRNCSKNNVYSVDLDQCIPRPLDDELC